MKTLISTLILAIALMGCGGNVDEPRFSVISQEGQIQLREYEATAIAYTMVEGERREAVNQGFRRLFNYIDGANVGGQSIPMTAPVTQAAADSKSQKIPMTAPVAQEEVGENEWKVVFYMPNDAKFSILPTPTDERVKLEEIPSHRRIVKLFAGSFSNENLAEHEADLRAYMKANKIGFKEPAIYAGYNPPWTLPFARRNEVMFYTK